MNEFYIKTKVFFGENSLAQLGDLKGRRALIITDPFMVESGAINLLKNHLDWEKIKVFKDIVPDPPIEKIVKGVEVLNEYKPEAIIALGGGSAIDAAKAIKEFSKKIYNYEEEILFIAIPTTSGTGSEVTSFSVITDSEKNIKYPLVSNDLLPDIAILDSNLVKSVPDFITADTGIDVLTHALEAYVSTEANDFSDALAEKAIVLVDKFLVKAYKNGKDNMAREKVHNASCLAGMAFNMVSLGLNHGIAHNLGANFHIPHGRCNGILLPYIIEYNSELKGYNQREHNLAANKYKNIAKILNIPSSSTSIAVRGLINYVKRLQKEMNMITEIGKCNVDLKEYREKEEIIAEGALKDRCTKTNPKTPTKEDIIKILRNVY